MFERDLTVLNASLKDGVASKEMLRARRAADAPKELKSTRLATGQDAPWGDRSGNDAPDSHRLTHRGGGSVKRLVCGSAIVGSSV